MYKYETIIYWSDEDQAFIAEVPELPGCMAHGASQDEALSNAKEAIQLWLVRPVNLATQSRNQRDVASSMHKAPNKPFESHRPPSSTVPQGLR